MLQFKICSLFPFIFLNKLQSSDFQLRSPVFRLPSSVFRLPTSVFRLPSSVFRLPTPVFGLRSSVFRLPTSVFGLRSSVSQLPSLFPSHQYSLILAIKSFRLNGFIRISLQPASFISCISTAVE
ncbi:MAG: hypothetical protein CVU08_10870 [Bacteroidetes bacterium HGW-Bacteroidetes-3]|nr:MAG: hypothetical protein CVU08_10870 [Bacteroidetes bacterium HGW-Bacteroidetes-3]